MMDIVIERKERVDVQTLGQLTLYDKEPLFKCVGFDWGYEHRKVLMECMTLELPWRDNERYISKIPEGEYKGVKHISPNFGKSIWIQDVPNRSEILIHVGNFYTDILGCILVGDKLADINGDGNLDVLNSRTTINRLYELCDDTVNVIIR